MAPSAFKTFATSPHHAWLGLITLGVGLASTSALGLMIGAGAYALGWIYLPDSRLFKAWRAKKASASPPPLAESATARMLKERDRLFAELSPSGKSDYKLLAGVAREIERYLAREETEGGSPIQKQQLLQLDQLMMTYLRLLRTEDNLRQLMKTEDVETLKKEIHEMEEAVDPLAREVKSLEDLGEATLALKKRRILDSRVERLEAMRQRFRRLQEAEANLELSVAEQERLGSALRLIRADLLSSDDASKFTHRIDASTRQIGEMNTWVSSIFSEEDNELEDVRAASQRIGYVVSD